MAKVLKVAAGQQRLDSTHILSAIALLTRLGLLCETIRLFLRDVRKVDPQAYGELWIYSELWG